MSPGATGRLELACHGVLLVSLVGVGAWLHVPGADNVGSPALVRRFIVVLACAAVVYGLACRRVLRDGGGRGTCAFVLAVAVAARLPALAAPPFLSSDLFRYVWDGRVQLAGINPYRFVPADTALAALRDHAIFDHVNRRFYAPTIYPPAAELGFRLIAAVRQTPFAAKCAAVLWESVTVGALALCLRRCGLSPSRVLLYAWNPLAIWCFAGNGHVDAEAAALIAIALLARAYGRDGWAGAGLGAAIAVKFLPAAIAPALWRGRWRLLFAGTITIAALYAPFLAVGPRRVFGFLGAYGGEEGFRDGSGVWLLAGLRDLLTLPPSAMRIYAVAAVLLLGGLAAVIASARPRTVEPGSLDDVSRVAGGAGLLAASMMLLISPHYPWYFVFLAVFAVLRPSRALLWMSVAPLALYLTPLHEFFIWPSLIYGPALVLFVRDEWPVLLRRPLFHPVRERIAR